MAWASHEEKKVVLPLAELEAKETNWGLSPISERDRWVADFRAVDYEVYGEYEVDEDLTLMRFRCTGSEDELQKWQCRRYHNVLLSKKMPPYKVFDPTFGSKK